MKEELMITKEDLVNWLDRQPSNDDLDLIGFITTRLENFYKLEQENKQLKSILTELEEWLSNFNRHSELEVWEIKNKIQKLKEKFDERR